MRYTLIHLKRLMAMVNIRPWLARSNICLLQQQDWQFTWAAVTLYQRCYLAYYPSSAAVDNDTQRSKRGRQKTSNRGSKSGKNLESQTDVAHSELAFFYKPECNAFK